MRMICKTRRWECVWLGLGALFVSVCAGASTGDFYASYQAKVVGHVALQGKTAQQMLLQPEGRKEYLYVREAGQSDFTVINVTRPKHAKVIGHVQANNLAIVDAGIAISETPERAGARSAQAVSVKSSSGDGGVPQSVRVLDITDPAHPRTVQTFDGVTSIVRDDQHNMIYVANGDGIWILSHQAVLRRHLCSSSDAISSAIPNCD
jgi:hypothetical protein